ncbi:MAG TPA: hypothetical protein VFC38_13105 [Stellaceae bacterium]|nr:hypothetical protein [Stellaceae bacterium]
MDTVFFFFSLAGVLMVVHWLVTNDRAGNRGKTSGIFAMREPEDIAKETEVAAKGKFDARRAKAAARPAPKPAGQPAFTRREF